MPNGPPCGRLGYTYKLTAAVPCKANAAVQGAFLADTLAPLLAQAEAARVRTELIVSRSRFIATAGPADTVAAARAFIAGIRAEMPDANHHVYAIGHGATTTLGQSDDGEPSGTSGRPALAVLRGSGLGDTVLVITRYFGGTKLGTGGLVKAYGDAAKAVLAELPRAEKIARQTLTVTLPYPAYEPVRRLLSTFAGTIEEEAFGEGVTLRVELPVARVAEFTRGLGDASAGAARVKQGPA